jgi:hypothetical protein
MTTVILSGQLLKDEAGFLASFDNVIRRLFFHTAGAKPDKEQL